MDSKETNQKLKDMNYNQSGMIRPIYSNYVSAEKEEVVLESEEIKPVTPVEPEAPAEAPKVTVAVVKPNFADRAFFYAREYWWAVALAAFLLGRYLKRKGA